MQLKLVGRHHRATRRGDVHAAIEALKRDGRVSIFAIGKIRRIKHGRTPGTVEIKNVLQCGMRLNVYGPNIIVEGVGR
jgi:hypothetical protein